MTDWRDKVLNRILWQDAPLVVVLDPDQLLLEEKVFQTLLAEQFDLLTYTDPIDFRYVYEPNYREPWDNEQKTSRLIVRFPHVIQKAVPFDLLQWGECIQITLAELFPELYYQTVQSLGPKYYDSLFEVVKTNPGKRLGQKQTAKLILNQIFSILPDDVRTSADLIALLCRIHYNHQIVPDVLIDYCLGIWAERHFIGIPEIRPLFDHDTFMAYLQDEWVRCLSTDSSAPIIPFADDQIRLYIDTFFLEGALKPVPISPSTKIPNWAFCGIILDENSEQLPRLKRLLDKITEIIQGPYIRLDEWQQCARLWAEAVALLSALSPAVPDPTFTQYNTLHQSIEAAFGDWILATFPTLPDRSYLPTPVMVHQIPHYLARVGGERIALIVMDGMALDQWLIIKEMLGEDLTYIENLTCAWIPTLTSISRRSLLAGEKPSLVSGLHGVTDTEEHLWSTFWQNQSVPEKSIGYSRGNTLVSDTEVDDLVHDATSPIVGFVINTIDDFMHRTMMGIPQMHDSVRRWMKFGTLRRFITRLLDRGYLVYITADHGNVCATGMGVPRQGVLVEETSVRARLYDHTSFAEEAHSMFPEDSIVWPAHYLGTGHAVLLANGLKAFSYPGKEILSHGSISIEEVIVPFVEIRRK